MATLEERLQKLEHAQSVLRDEHISDIKQLNERIDALEQQIIEQRRRMTEQEQSTHQRFDSLEKALSTQFTNIDQRFDSLEKALAQRFASIDQHFASIDQQFATMNQQFAQMHQSLLRLEQQNRQQTEEIKAKFEVSDHFATRTWGVVQEQQRDIRALKEFNQTILNRLDSQDQILQQILARLPK